eukprot:TRINITY_DN52671_c0_g1_i1.p1 TRINITY_DN52671_c0_g1~~TRINITY_DN52671_c0_g1_i1.p1  ORF type:complete len:134 (-),score=27.71 TRINITY_DN52671_c0_g1_i1:66-467(-)
MWVEPTTWLKLQPAHPLIKFQHECWDCAKFSNDTPNLFSPSLRELSLEWEYPTTVAELVRVIKQSEHLQRLQVDVGCTWTVADFEELLGAVPTEHLREFQVTNTAVNEEEDLEDKLQQFAGQHPDVKVNLRGY